MNILRQLWQDAQSVLRDMSVTQRVAVTFLVLAVAVCLTFAAWLGSTPSETGRRPLPVTVEPGDINDVLARLKEKGIKTAEYDYDARRVLVNVDEEKKAVIAMAEEGLLTDAHAFNFERMLESWAFSDTTRKSDEAMRLARSNEVARLIENIDGIKEAQVIYSDDARRSLFGVAHKKTASVRVRTELKKPLTDDHAETIIALVAAAKAGLDPRDVVVTDQMGNKFHTSSSNGLTAIAKQKWDTEFALNEQLRRTLEGLMRKFVPNIQYEGDVNAFPKHEVAFDIREQQYQEILPGEVANSSSYSMTRESNQRPAEEPGVNPNARRSANLSTYGYWYTTEDRSNEKRKEQTNQNSIRTTTTRFAPKVDNLTVSAIIHLPYRLRRDADGKPVQAANEMGETLEDPETGMPMWERESVPFLPADNIEELKRQIAHAAGIALADIPEKIEVSQVPWMPPVLAPKGGETAYSRSWQWLRGNAATIATLLFFVAAIVFIVRYALRPIPTEVDDHVEPEAISLALSSAAEEDEEMMDDAWDKLRAKVAAAVQEDPKRAANLLKRWMRKD